MSSVQIELGEMGGNYAIWGCDASKERTDIKKKGDEEKDRGVEREEGRIISEGKVEREP